jgi:hypothetical protein
MPAKPPWLLLIPEIVAAVETFDVPVVDRSTIERLFGLRRRRAIQLMHEFGGYQAGRTFLIDRKKFLDQLRRLTEGEGWQVENRRRERLDQQLDGLRRDQAAIRVKIPVETEAVGRNIQELSAGVDLAPGCLRIEFDNCEDLLRKLYELSRAAANDFDRFRAATEPVRQSA